MMNGTGTKQKKINTKVSKAMNLLNDATKDEMNLAKDVIMKSSNQAKESLNKRTEEIKKSLETSYGKTTDYIKESPVKSVFLAGAIMFILGMLFNWRKR